MKKIKLNKTGSFIFAIIVSIFSSVVISIGVKIFLSPNQFLSTGVTGIALILGRLYDVIFKPETSQETFIAGIAMLILNIPVLLLAWKKLSPRFMLLSLINVVVNSVCVAILPNNLHEILHLSVANGDISFLDAALFVGLMNGAANALAYIVGGSTGGSDVLSMYFSIKKQGSVGKFTTIINSIVIGAGLFLGVENAIAKAFYTLVYLVINSIVIDLFYIRNRRAVLLITTTKGEELAKEITHSFVRGVTVMQAKGGYTGEEKQVLYCACSSFEVIDITNKVKEIDDHAFITVLEANKVHGNFINKELR